MKALSQSSHEIDPNIDRDTALLRRIAQKDSVAFREFYRLYSGLVFATIQQVLNNHDDSEDIMQEVLAGIWQKAHLYEPGKGKPLTWVTTMARNRAIDRIRAKQRRSRLNEGFENEHKITQPEFEESSSDLLQDVERDRMVRRAVKLLSPEQRQAITLTYFHGLSQAAVAKRLHEPLGTIKARIRRGVDRLEGLVKLAM